MEIRASTRKLFRETPEAYRLNFLFEVFEHKNSAKRKATDTFDEIMKRLEDGERHNSRGMKEMKRKLDKWIASFSKHSTLFMEWGELTEAIENQRSGESDPMH